MFVEIISILTIAVVTVWLFKHFNLPPILAYLTTGVISGTHGANLLPNPDEIHFIAELGIVFLLFTLGLEFSIPKLMSMRHWVFGVGSAQVILTILIIIFVAMGLGYNWVTGLTIGGILALSSTAIVIKQLTEAGILGTKRGKLAVSILLFQDIAVVPLLIAIPILSGSGEHDLGYALMLATGKGIIVFGILLAVGKWILPRIFHSIARVRTDELFVLTTLLVALIAAGLTHAFELSMTLGAFLAGMMLGESQYRHQLEADIRPFRDILMGLFFITVGKQLNIDIVIANIHWLLLLLVGILVLKMLLIRLITFFWKIPALDGWSTGITLAQMGEFGFVLTALATDYQIINEYEGSLLIGVGIFSMALTPWMMNNSLHFARRFTSLSPSQSKVTEEESELKEHVLICGYGRVGQTISRFLKLEAVPFIALDIDPMRTSEAQMAGENIKFGNASQSDILLAAGIKTARLVIITIDDFHKIEAVIKQVKKLTPEVKILVRTRDDDHLQELQDAGATEVVPEVLEGSLMLVSHVLSMTGTPVNRIIKRVRAERKNHYRSLHGFYPGEHTELNENYDRLESLHSIPLDDGAFVIGKTISELNLKTRRVKLAGLRRNGKEVSNPAPTTVLKANDILVIKGKPRILERTERYFMQG